MKVNTNERKRKNTREMYGTFGIEIQLVASCSRDEGGNHPQTRPSNVQTDKGLGESRKIRKNGLLTSKDMSSVSLRRTLVVSRDVINFAPPFLRKMIFVSPGGGVEYCVARDNRNIRTIWLFYSMLLFVTSNIAITDVTDVITTRSDIFILFFS